MQAITVRDRDAGVDGLSLVDTCPTPKPARTMSSCKSMLRGSPPAS
jgi:hypothetical protein